MEHVGQISIDKPVFVIGTGRSGLTPLMDLIAYHEAFAWPSQYNARWPSVPQLSLLSRVVEVAPFDSRLKFRRLVPTHVEGYEMWSTWFRGFARPFRDLVADDVTPYVRDLVRGSVAAMTRYQGKRRFIAEYSGWSRIEFVKAIFPDAKFIHIVRDGRAVAHSYAHSRWWNGWEGVYRWRLGMPSPDVLEKLERYDQSFLALAAVYWKILVTNICAKSSSLPRGDGMVMRYEDLVANPRAEAFRCLEFCGLEPDPRFVKHLSTVRIVDANNKSFRIPPWKENLSREQIHMMHDLIGEDLAQFGYQ